MGFRRLRLVPVVVAAMVLAACTGQPVPQQFAEISFTHLPPIRLDVASVEIVDAYRPPLRDPNVEHRAPTPPATAARRWAEDRLLATGATGRRASFTIQQASIIETELDEPGGVRGLITRSQSERYDAELTVELAVFGLTGAREGLAAATARRSRTVSESITLAERERIWQEMVEALIDDLNARLQATIDNTLRPFMS